ncbi:hypothetical protein BBP40_006778 [Aspergillus hancockii]|nr:hypothetical protein BBP40_006778 [Aspergillus hancockii]
MAGFIYPKLSFTQKGSSSLMNDEQKLASAERSLSSLHAFTLTYLKNQFSPSNDFREDCVVQILPSDEERIASMLADASHGQLDLHEQTDSDEDEDRHLNSSPSNTSSTRSIHGSPSPPPTPPNFHFELDLSNIEPFPDYYESCEHYSPSIDKTTEEAYKKAISEVFEESRRIRKLDTGATSVSPLTSQVVFPTKSNHSSQTKSNIPSTSQYVPPKKTDIRDPVYSMSTAASEVASAVPLCVESDKVMPMTSASQAKASLERTSLRANKATFIAPFMSNDVSVRSVASEVVSLPIFAYQNVSSENAGVQTRHHPISSSSASTDSSRELTSEEVQAPPASHPISHAGVSKHCKVQNNQDHRSDFLTTRPTLLGGLSSAHAQAAFTSLSGSLPLSGSICGSQAHGTILSIDEIVTPDEPRTPNFQLPIGTGRLRRDAAPKQAPSQDTQCQNKEENERKLNVLEEIKIILRTDSMKDDVLRRFTTMTNIVLRMEWILFRRDLNAEGAGIREFLSPRVVDEMEELTVPMVQYLAWLDKKLQNERSTAEQVLQTVIEVAKDQDLDVYQRFKQTAQVIIENLRKPRPLEKHLLAVFQDLYDVYVYSKFLSLRNRQIIREGRPNIKRDSLTRLLIAGWDVLNRTIENYNETITINHDLKSRFVEPVMQRLPNSYEIWEEEWNKHQEQWEIQREMQLTQMLAEAEEMAYAEAQRQEIARAETRAMAEFRAQAQAYGQRIWG